MLVCGLIGDPVEHSLSAFMHNAAFAELGIDARYDLWPTHVDALPERLASLRQPDVLGANVTVPHKQAVIPFLDEVSETARRIGAVNTIVPRDGRLLGDNTDAWGFGQSLRELTGGGILESALVVGAGGAARAVLVSLQDAGVERISLVNRTHVTAQRLAADLNAPDRPDIVAETWSRLADLAPTSDMVVNATSIGWHGDELPFEATIVERLPPNVVVLDLTYRHTAFLRLTDARGLRAGDGLPMLIHQGARAFELWTGQTAPVDVMTHAARRAHAERG